MSKTRKDDSVPIIGVWKLISFESHTDKSDVSYPFGEDPKGCIIYTESGRFSVQLMRTNRPHFASGDQLKGTVGEIEANYQGCVAYYGSYTIDRDGGFVVHHVEGSLFPNWERQSLKRYFELSGNRLKLTTPPTLWGGVGEIVGMLKWERIG